MDNNARINKTETLENFACFPKDFVYEYKNAQFIGSGNYDECKKLVDKHFHLLIEGNSFGNCKNSAVPSTSN